MLVFLFSIIILVLFVISTVACVYFFIKLKKNKLIYKSIFSSLFKSFSSLIIIISFYAVTFSLVGAFNSYSVQIEDSLSELVLDNYSHQIDYNSVEINDLENSSDDYNNLFFFSISRLDSDDSYTTLIDPDNSLKSEAELIAEYDNFMSVEFGINNFWENLGFTYFQNLNNFISVLLFWTEFNAYNDNPSNYEGSGELVYNIYPNYTYAPLLSDSYNEVYYLMGYNNISQTVSNQNYEIGQFFRYSGTSGSYYIDNMIIDDYATGYDYNSTIESLSTIDSTYDENGTKQHPFKIVAQREYVEANNIDIDTNNVIKINDYYFEIMATANFSNVILPIYSLNNFITDFTQQGAFLMNPRSVAEIANGDLEYSFNFGFTDIYNDADNLFYYQDLEASTEENTTITTRALIMENEILDETKTNDDFLSINNSIHIHSFGTITEEEVTLESYRVSGAIDEISNETTFLNFFMYVFLVIIVFILILLIQKRVKDYSKQFGTLKALGLSRNEASVAFLIYPMFVIGVSGFIALLISIPVQFFLLGFYTSFFSIPTVTIGFSFSSFFYVMLFPALILFAIAVIISSWILRKPPIDLLSNKINDEPNMLVIASGKLVPKNASFSYAYKFKGLSKAWGKSLLLIVSIFFATTLTALSISATTLVDDVQTTSNETFNYQYVSLFNQSDYDYDVYDVTETTYKDSQNPLYHDQLIIDNPNWVTIKNSDADTLYQFLGDSVLYTDVNGPEEDVMTINVVENGAPQYYIPKEALWNFYIILGLIKNDEPNFDLSTEWGASGYSAVDFLSITSFFRLSVEFSLANIGYDFNDVINGIKTETITSEFLVSHSSDLLFRDVYYNSNYQTVMTGGNTSLSYIDEENSSQIPGDTDYDETRLNIFKNPESVENVYDMGDNSVSALEEQEQLQIDNGGTLPYIPVVIDSFTFNYIRILEPDLFTYDPIDNSYNAQMYFTDDSNDIDVEPINVKVVDVYQSFISVGFTTTENLVLNYDWGPDIDYQKIYYQSIFWSNYPNEPEEFVDNSITLTLTNQYTNTNDGETIAFGEYVNNAKVLQSSPKSKEAITSQTDVIFNIINGFLLIISIFAMLVAIILVVIAIKDINDKSKKEVAMLKAIGYTNAKSVSLVLTPYIIIIILGFIVSIPFSILILLVISNALTNLTGSAYSFTLTTVQWFLLSIFIIVLIGLLLLMAYNSFRKTNPLEAIKGDE